MSYASWSVPGAMRHADHRISCPGQKQTTTTGGTGHGAAVHLAEAKQQQRMAAAFADTGHRALMGKGCTGKVRRGTGRSCCILLDSTSITLKGARNLRPGPWKGRTRNTQAIQDACLLRPGNGSAPATSSFTPRQRQTDVDQAPHPAATVPGCATSSTKAYATTAGGAFHQQGQGRFFVTRSRRPPQKRPR